MGSSNSLLQEIVCCIGQPVAGNPLQYIMEKALAAADLDWRYLTLEVAPAFLGDAIRGIKAMGFRGANITIPHQVSVLPYLDALSDEANLMGAVNCIYRDENRLVGENTDGKGFVRSLQGHTDLKAKHVVVLGAGGAARAIAVEAALAAAKQITIVNRTEERGRQLARLLNEKVKVTAQFVLWRDEYSPGPETEVLINATSIGHSDGRTRLPIRLRNLSPSTVVVDVTVNPPQSPLLMQAADQGCPVINGVGMLVQQAAMTFKIWTGFEADVGLMHEALEEFLEL